MRVLLVSHRYPPDGIAGVEQYTHRLASELTKAGDVVSVVARRWTDTPPEPRTVRERLPDGTTVYRMIGGGWASLERFLLHHERLEQLFTAALVEAAPDVVHFNHLIGLSPRFVEIAHRLRTAVVLSLHDFYFACPLAHLQKRSGELCQGPDAGRECARSCFTDEGPDAEFRWGLRAAYFRQLLGGAQRLVAGSRYVASYFEQFAPHKAEVRVIPNGVGDEELDPVGLAHPTPRARGALNLVYWGTVVRHKGPHVIIEALRLARLGPVNLLVLGHVPDAPDMPKYLRKMHEQAAQVPGLNFRLHGRFERHELPKLLHDTDCVVLPSLVPEAGPQSPREALARGIPLLVSKLGALPETIREGENGFSFDPARPGELAALLQRITREEGLLERLREGVRATRPVTVDEHAAAVRRIYEEARAELRSSGAPSNAEFSELRFLHGSVAGIGFGIPD